MVNKEEETVVTKEANFTIESVAAWDDAKCQELEKTVSFPLINIRNVLRTFIATDQKLQTLRTIFFRGMLRGYTIKCPECGEDYNVSVADFDRTSIVKCPKCGKEHKQDENIINIVVDDNVSFEKPKKKRVSKKKVASK